MTRAETSFLVVPILTVRWKSTSMNACTVLHSVQFLRAILSCRINGWHFRVSQDSNLRNVFCVAPIGFPVTRIRIRICSIQNEVIQVCRPTNMTSVDVGDWNRLVFTAGFNVTSWQTRLQLFLTFKGNLTAPDSKPPYPLSNAASVNPFTTAQFGCFNDFSDIQYRDKNYSFSTPFINWWSCVCQLSWNIITDLNAIFWTDGAGRQNRPYILCSISICNTTVYDAQYNINHGSILIDNSSFILANASAAVAVSGAGMFLGTADTNSYQYGSQFIDDQIQLDLLLARNTYGNFYCDIFCILFDI